MQNREIKLFSIFSCNNVFIFIARKYTKPNYLLSALTHLSRYQLCMISQPTDRGPTCHFYLSRHHQTSKMVPKRRIEDKSLLMFSFRIISSKSAKKWQPKVFHFHFTLSVFSSSNAFNFSISSSELASFCSAGLSAGVMGLYPKSTSCFQSTSIRSISCVWVMARKPKK